MIYTYINYLVPCLALDCHFRLLQYISYISTFSFYYFYVKLPVLAAAPDSFSILLFQYSLYIYYPHNSYLYAIYNIFSVFLHIRVFFTRCTFLLSSVMLWCFFLHPTLRISLFPYFFHFYVNSPVLAAAPDNLLRVLLLLLYTTFFSTSILLDTLFYNQLPFPCCLFY